MGYSVAAPVRSQELFEKMYRFIAKNFRMWPEVMGEPGWFSYASRPLRTGQLSYDNGRRSIGFDYNAYGGEREYIFALVRWMAIKVGRRTPYAKIPFYVYDGHEVEPIYMTEPHDQRANTVDEWGVPVYDKENLTSGGKWRVLAMLETLDEGDALDVIRKEIQRLDALWIDQEGAPA
jgi:hypothetical protein